MLRISATYTIQRTIEIEGFDSLDDDGAEEKVEAASVAIAKGLENEGWKVTTDGLVSEDEFEDEDEEEDDDDEEDDEDDEDDEDEDDEGDDEDDVGEGSS